jgi:hypothetical protein
MHGRRQLSLYLHRFAKGTRAEPTLHRACHRQDGGKNPVRDGDYLLLELMKPTRAGSITGNVVAIERQDESGDNQYLLRVVSKTRGGQYV